MIHHKRSTILAVTLLSITLSTTGCIQKQERVVRSVVHQASQQQPQQPQQHLGAKTVPYTEVPSSSYIQPVVQYQQPTIQPIQQPIVQYQPSTIQPIQQSVVQPREQSTMQYVQQPEIEYTPPVQDSVQYIETNNDENNDKNEDEGCSDDVVSGCDRGSIDKSQLSSNYTEESFGGTVHSFKSVQGSPIQIGERKNGFTFPTHPGKVIILEMFGQTCPHCIKEIPTLKKLKSRYGSKLEVIAIHSQGVMGKSAAKRFIGRHRVNYPIVDSNNATDLQYFIQNTYGWTGVLPFTMVVKDGVTQGSVSGEASYKELNEIINPLF